jgi:hypothetical protein
VCTGKAVHYEHTVRPDRRAGVRCTEYEPRGRFKLGWVVALGAVGQGHTLVPVSTQLELTLPLFAQLKLTVYPMEPKLTGGCVPEVLKLSSKVSDVFPKVLKLSFKVSECKPLPSGCWRAGS